MANLQLSAVKKRFGSTQTIHGVDLTINAGEFIVFVGPSGCGKSTLLRMIAGLESVTEGKVEIASRNVTRLPPSQRKVAMVFQSYALYPHMTVADNLSFGMRMRGEPRQAIAEKVEQACNVLQLEPYLKRKPGELSGGQCQRVAIGRALVQNPDVFLFDEPLSNLDAELRVKMRTEIAALHRRLQATMIYVTHDQTEAMTLADRIVVLRDGRIEQVGTPMELYHNPVNQFVAGFIGSPKMNFISLPVATGAAKQQHLALRSGDRLLQLPLAANGATDAINRATLGIRPEHISLVAGDGCLQAEVTALERLGPVSFVYVQVGEESFCVQTASQKLPAIGDAVALHFDSCNAYLFDESGVCLSPAKQFQDAVEVAV